MTAVIGQDQRLCQCLRLFHRRIRTLQRIGAEIQIPESARRRFSVRHARGYDMHRTRRKRISLSADFCGALPFRIHNDFVAVVRMQFMIHKTVRRCANQQQSHMIHPFCDALRRV